MTQRDGMGKEVGGGFRMGNTVNPWLIYVNVWQNPLQYCKVISLQLIKINEKKKKRILVWVAISSSRGSSQPKDQICISYIPCIGRWFLYHCATWEAHFNHKQSFYSLKLED